MTRNRRALAVVGGALAFYALGYWAGRASTRGETIELYVTPPAEVGE